MFTSKKSKTIPGNVSTFQSFNFLTMSSKNFIKLLLQNNAKLGNLPDKDLAHQFIDDIFRFLFIPKTGVNQKESDLEKGFYSLQSHLATLIYDVLNDGAKSQNAVEVFLRHYQTYMLPCRKMQPHL
ncbi:hypothetical protein LWM68_38930 [Niabella sp. W65]|nr:hypothetical protein [Niabella sp. W65]MCH7368187.1 hypothetical protein [Niabella sp. W65]ULT43798.1 hypothetical protein KRR40_10590 [Niabella sp. I65]